MKSHRSVLVGLAVTVGLFAACQGDQSVVVPPPALEVSVTPATVPLEVGGSAQITASVTGGEEGVNKSVTWSTSNAGIASIAANGNTVTVTGESAGTATITATSAADANVNASAVVTVTEEPVTTPSISISRITTFVPNVGDVDAPINNIQGQISVISNLEVPAGTEINRVETLIDNTVVCSQDFSGAAGAGDAAAAPVTCTFNTAAFTVAGGVATVGFENGPHTLVVQVIGPQGTVIAQASGGQFSTLLFNNPNFFSATLTSPTNCIVGATDGGTGASFWCQGAITADVVPVIFNTVQIASVTLTATPGGADTDSSSPFSPTIDAEDVEEAVTLKITSITSGGQPGPACINPDPILNPINVPGDPCSDNNGTWVLGTGGLPTGAFLVDNVAPDIDVLDITPARLCEGIFPACRVNANMAFDPDDDELITFDDAGVSASGPAPATVEFFAGLPGAEIPVMTGADLSATNGGPGERATADFVLKVTVTDGLGNAITRWADDTGFDGQTTAGDSDNQKFGYDETAPTFTFTFVDDGSINALPAATTVSYSDAGVGPSGFLPDPVRFMIEQWTAADGQACYLPDGGTEDDCDEFYADDGDATTLNGSFPGDGFYRVTVYVVDASYPGGNQSTQEVVMSLSDATAPSTIGVITAPGIIEPNSDFTVTTSMEDDVGLGSYQISVGYGSNIAFLGLPRTDLGTFDLEALIGADNGTTMVTDFINVVVDNAGGLPTTEYPATSLTYAIRDLAGHMLRFARAEDGDGNAPPAYPNDGFCAIAAQPVGVPTPTGAGPAQNCVEQQLDIAAQVQAGDVPTGMFDFLIDLNDDNADHGLFEFGSATPSTICNGFDCGNDPTSTTLTATVTGPVGSFTDPFASVQFYYLDSEHKWQHAGTAGAPSASSSGDVLTLTYSATWDASSDAVRPAGVYTVAAVAFNGEGQVLFSTPGNVTIEEAP